jgi:2-iminobutanoate/2-iminopropanoate deaminase
MAILTDWLNKASGAPLICKVDNVPDAPPPAGHYSPAVIHNGTIYVSGQLARVPGAAPDFVPEGMAAQVTQCLTNAETILKAAGADRNHVLRATVYVTGIEGWPEANAAFAAFFGDHKPARSIVPVGKFKSTFLVEIDIVAAAPST